MESWRRKSTRAFRFWRELLAAFNESDDARGRYEPFIAHLRQFEKKSRDTFSYLVSRGADPVYLLHVLVLLCDEDRVRHYVGFPYVATLEMGGTFPHDLGNFHLVTESDMKTIESGLPTLEKAGLTSDLARIEQLRKHFEALPEPPGRAGYAGEKAVMYAEVPVPNPKPPPRKGRPGEHFFNTAMVLLARHLEQTAAHTAPYSSIALLLNAFCPATFQGYPLSRETVRQRILFVQDRPEVETYQQYFEQWFADWKAFIQRNPFPFNPWTS